jgi:ABC-type molybdate transport system substrate-binding protein/sugar lactone lactonase YvrE
MTFCRSVLAFVGLVWVLAPSAAPQAPDAALFRLLASNGMKAVVEELKPQLEHAVGHPLAIEYNSTTGLEERIASGAPFDVAILTSDAVSDLAKQGKLRADTRTDFAKSGVGLAVKSGTPKPDISTPDLLKRTIEAASSITYAGDGASRPSIDSMFETLGIFDKTKPKLVLTKGSGAAMASVAEGKVAVVMTLMSELLPIKGIDIAGPFPAEVQSYVSFGAAANVKAADLAGAKALIAFLKSPAAAPVYKAKGMNAVLPDDSLPHPYRTVRDWASPPNGLPWAAVTGVEEGPDGNIYVLYRCHENSCAGRPEDPILKFDKSGKLLKSWGAGMFVFPHGSTIDRQGNFWATDGGGMDGKGHQVFKFSPDGKLLMTLGKAGVAGDGPDTFNQPTDVVVAPNGDIFVADGHRDSATARPGNNRIVKFSKDGKFLRQWGRKGTAPGEFQEPHTIAMDSRGRLFVGDRMNNRIQIFDQNGKFLEEWKQFGRPSGIYITKDDTIYVADSESGPDTGAGELETWRKGIRIGSAKTGKVTAFIEDLEWARPEHSGAEGVGVDSEGNVYGAVVRRRMLEKHIPVNGR